MQKSQCLSYRSLQERREGLEALNLLKEKEEEKKEDGDDEKEMEGKRRDKEGMQDVLVVEKGMIFKLPLVPLATCLLPLQLLMQGPLQ